MKMRRHNATQAHYHENSGKLAKIHENTPPKRHESATKAHYHKNSGKLAKIRHQNAPPKHHQNATKARQSVHPRYISD